jgi:hypothetical protein
VGLGSVALGKRHETVLLQNGERAGAKEMQIPPLRYAPVGMTILSKGNAWNTLQVWDKLYVL